MTKPMHQVQLDRWLICSDAAFHSLKNYWRGEAGRLSLLDWRLSNQIIESVPIQSLDKRLDEIAAKGLWAVTVVVDTADVGLIERLEIYADRMTIHLVEWRESPLVSVHSMNVPDRELITVLQDIGSGSVDILSQVSDLEGFVTALSAWETACREYDTAMFAEAFPAYATSAVPWHRLLAMSAPASSQPAAANDNWVELIRLAAATADEPGKAVSLEDPRNTPAQWTLTLSPIDGGPTTLAVFRVNQSAIPAFRGCAIRLRVRGEIIEMGAIDDEGEAEIVLPSPVEMQGLAIAWEQGD